MNQYLRILKNTYHDSVTLMLLSRKLLSIPGTAAASVSMATPHNREILSANGFSSPDIDLSGPNDLIIAIRTDSSDETVSKLINDFFSEKTTPCSESLPVSVSQGIEKLPDADLALISVPGEYAAFEASRCLDHNLNVMIFSDNVSIEDELFLKKKACKKNLLVMGPDCGTSIINGIPLAFANRVRRGKIGIVGASGTGIQEISVCIHKFGLGISQAIGTGGRDLSADIGGITMKCGLKLLDTDSDTEVIVLISKPPAKSVASDIINTAGKCTKPVIICFLGSNPEVLPPNCISASTLMQAAELACRKASDQVQSIAEVIADFPAEVLKNLKPDQQFLRGLYTGGTLCKEAIILLKNHRIFSNIPLTPETRLPDSRKSTGHTIIDLGEDEFTAGKPHPMIDPYSRNERLFTESEDSSVRVFLFDVMLGFGSHHDPAGELASAVLKSRKIARSLGFEPVYAASVCGVDEDPQNCSISVNRLISAGIAVFPTNAYAVKAVSRII